MDINKLGSFDEAMQIAARQYLLQVLDAAKGNVVHAARMAGKNRTHFYELLKRAGIRQLPSWSKSEMLQRFHVPSERP